MIKNVICSILWWDQPLWCKIWCQSSEGEDLHFQWFGFSIGGPYCGVSLLSWQYEIALGPICLIDCKGSHIVNDSYFSLLCLVSYSPLYGRPKTLHLPYSKLKIKLRLCLLFLSLEKWQQQNEDALFLCLSLLSRLSIDQTTLRVHLFNTVSTYQQWKRFRFSILSFCSLGWLLPLDVA